MAGPVESSIARFYSNVSQMQDQCHRQMQNLLVSLQEANTPEATQREREHLDMIIHLTSQLSDTYFRTAGQLAELQRFSNQGRMDELRNMLDLNFFIKERQFGLIQREMEQLQIENKSLRERNDLLLGQIQEQALGLRRELRQGPLATWNVTVVGANLQGRCNNSRCEAYNKRVIKQIGKGEFPISDLVFEATCPICNKDLEEADRIIFDACEYSYEGKTRDKQTLKDRGIVPRNETKNIDIKNWILGKINAY